MVHSFDSNSIRQIVRPIQLAALALFSLAFLLVACDDGDDAREVPEEPTVPFHAGSFLPDQSGGMDAASSTVVQTPAEVAEYSGVSGAEIMAAYGVVGLAAKVYRAEEFSSDISAEVVQFETHLGAYGYYARTRPAGVDTSSLGTEAFFSGNSLYFTQDKYVVTLSTLGEPDEIKGKLLPLAITISAQIGEEYSPPMEFTLFPSEGAILPSTRCVPNEFLGDTALFEVMLTDYALDGDSVTLFLTRDEHGGKFLRFSMMAGGEPDYSGEMSEMGFDQDFGVMFQADPHGTVIAGLKSGWLIGALGFNPDSHQEFVKAWINSFGQ